MADKTIAVTRALVSVSDKTGIIEFATKLAGLGVEILSTGGTAGALREAGLKITDVSEVTGFPEIMDGRVKTLHPAIHGGLLADRNKSEHMQAIEALGIHPIDLLVVNLYPFEATVEKGAGFDETIENIDIGGPAMIRAAAKNHSGLAVVVDPADYEIVAEEIAGGGVSAPTRRKLAAKAFSRTAAYDAAISGWLNAEAGVETPEWFAVGGRLLQSLRYGENPHQSARFYASTPRRQGVATARVVQGKELSYNNINDTDAAFELVAEFDTAQPAIAIIKHANPCGVATGPSLVEAYQRAHACDPVSAFGGIVAANRPLDAAAAEAITGIFTEVVIAPGADDEALAIFAAKKNLRLLLTEGLPDAAAPGLSIRNVAGGLLVQSRDSGTLAGLDLKVATKRAPTEAERADLLFAWRVAKHVKSNAIVYAKDLATVGIGAGQMSRVDSARIAARKAEDAAGEGAVPLTKGSVVASDAFFPFADGLMAAVAAGATAVIQPGGSMRDNEVIEAADAAGIAMLFTGMRHFRH
ncbi:MAG: bifunctional phosphoribosylaminoimidazolecarboxamide formyltransferase/IMP cyclohydrolase [Rhodobiaceae bacterium]|nr:bifunctional phosphoribosylaminoimidazolecarboxamide formyltransferase/IMP cyclohydrolase [Rhodobiaceae bacterium]